jgi:hypothetical protein
MTKAPRYNSAARVHMNFTPTAVTLYADVFTYKTESCSETVS